MTCACGALLLAAALQGEKPLEITINTVQEEMRYDVAEFTVKAGRPVRLTFRNPDFMPHNLMIVMPGSAQEVALAAEALGEKGFELHFRPDSDKILHATRMLDYEEEQVLEFAAPEKPGDYDYVCTFPMHWMMMRGVMHVVAGDAPAAGPKEAAPRREWTFADLEADVAAAPEGRSIEKGREAFARLGCRNCHKIAGEGGTIGPDLSDVLTRWKGSRADVLREILEPSRTVEEKYRAVRIRLKDGTPLFGQVTERTDAHVMIVTNPAEPTPRKVMRADIDVERTTEHSPMPKGLLNALEREEILDLLAFLESGGKEEAK